MCKGLRVVTDKEGTFAGEGGGFAQRGLTCGINYVGVGVGSDLCSQWSIVLSAHKENAHFAAQPVVEATG